MKNKKIFGGLLIAAGIILLIFILYHNSQKRQQALVFSPQFMLSTLWESYKKNYWQPTDGRTIDHQRSDVTTSEGQSYTMLRAVWQDDKPTFDKTWQWTEANLKRSDSNLFSWLYGKRSDGSYGILTDQGGQNTATDADSDIALALIFASNRWGDNSYLDQAKNIISDIWNQEVVEINGKPYVSADNLEKSATQNILINPSYLSPYSYRIFAKLDPAHNWPAVIDTSYQVLQSSSSQNLDKQSSAGLPPDWVVLDKTTGKFAATGNSSLTTNYGFDALRVPFRVGLDFRYNNEPRAKAVLDSFGFLANQWQQNGRLAQTYGHDGNVVSDQESPSMYGAAIAYFQISRPDLEGDVYKNKLLTLYSPDFQDWKTRLSYYDDNWSWFGIAFYNNLLPNLSSQ